jgi:hypothetical protein
VAEEAIFAAYTKNLKPNPRSAKRLLTAALRPQSIRERRHDACMIWNPLAKLVTDSLPVGKGRVEIRFIQNQICVTLTE